MYLYYLRIGINAQTKPGSDEEPCKGLFDEDSKVSECTTPEVPTSSVISLKFLGFTATPWYLDPKIE